MSTRTPTRAIAELRLLADVVNALNDLREPRAIVSTVLQMVVDGTTLRRATVLLRRPGSDVIFIEEAYGLSVTQQIRGRYKVGEGVRKRLFVPPFAFVW